METHTDGVEIYYPENREAWHNWLEQHHATKKALWVV
jgi:hypothetical protein